MSPKSKNTRGHLACSRAASALGLAHTMPRPAGSISPFCDPVIAKSTFHSSMRKSIEPMELTPSTYSRAGCCAASIALRTAPTSLVTPVAVSLWTSDVSAVRSAIDAAQHPALLYVDGVSSIGSIDFRMDEWKVDLAITGSQKGLMLPAGLGIVCASPKALAAREHAKC